MKSPPRIHNIEELNSIDEIDTEEISNNFWERITNIRCWYRYRRSISKISLLFSLNILVLTTSIRCNTWSIDVDHRQSDGTAQFSFNFETTIPSISIGNSDLLCSSNVFNEYSNNERDNSSKYYIVNEKLNIVDWPVEHIVDIATEDVGWETKLATTKIDLSTGLPSSIRYVAYDAAGNVVGSKAFTVAPHATVGGTMKELFGEAAVRRVVVQRDNNLLGKSVTRAYVSTADGSASFSLVNNDPQLALPVPIAFGKEGYDTGFNVLNNSTVDMDLYLRQNSVLKFLSTIKAGNVFAMLGSDLDAFHIQGDLVSYAKGTQTPLEALVASATLMGNEKYQGMFGWLAGYNLRPSATTLYAPLLASNDNSYTGVALSGPADVKHYGADGTLKATKRIIDRIFLVSQYFTPEEGHLEITGVNGAIAGAFVRGSEWAGLGAENLTSEKSMAAALPLSIDGNPSNANIINTSGTATNADVVLYDSTGKEKARTSVQLPAHGTRTIALEALVNTLSGSVTIDATQSIIAYLDEKRSERRDLTVVNGVNRANDIIVLGDLAPFKHVTVPTIDGIVNQNAAAGINFAVTDSVLDYVNITINGQQYKKLVGGTDFSAGGGGITQNFLFDKAGTYLINFAFYLKDGNTLKDADHTITATMKNLIDGVFTLTTYGGANIILPAPYSNQTLDGSKLDIEYNDSLTMTAKGLYNGTIGSGTQLSILLANKWYGTESGVCIVPINQKGEFNNTCTTKLTDTTGNYQYTFMLLDASGKQAGPVINAGSVATGVKGEPQDVIDIDKQIGPTYNSHDIIRNNLDKTSEILSDPTVIYVPAGKTIDKVTLRGLFDRATNGSTDDNSEILYATLDCSRGPPGYQAATFSIQTRNKIGETLLTSFATSSEKVEYQLRVLFKLK